MADVSTMVRAALIVSNLERSAAFYNEILGLTEVYREGELTHPAGAQLLGMPPNTKVRFKILKAEKDLNRGMVGLFEVSNPQPPRVDKRTNGVSIGEAVLVFYCADLDAVTRKLEAGGHAVLCPPLHLQVDATRGQPEMTFLDPDGVMINLIQRDPSNPM